MYKTLIIFNTIATLVIFNFVFIKKYDMEYIMEFYKYVVEFKNTKHFKSLMLFKYFFF